MAISSPSLALSIEALFGAVKLALGAITKIGATDFGADAPNVDIKAGATIKVPVSSVSAASAYDASSNNYLTGGSTDWASLTATHYLQGFDLSGVDIDSGVNAPRVKQLFARRAGSGIAAAIQSSTAAALDGATASTNVTLPSAPTLAQYIAAAADKAWLDKASSALVVNGSELALIRGVCAAAQLAGSDQDIAAYLGYRDLVCIPGMTARAVIVPATAVGFIGRVPTVIARYAEAGVETDPDTGLSVGIVVADDQAKNRQIVNADLWFGATVQSSNAGARWNAPKATFSATHSSDSNSFDRGFTCSFSFSKEEESIISSDQTFE